MKYVVIKHPTKSQINLRIISKLKILEISLIGQALKESSELVAVFATSIKTDELLSSKFPFTF